MVFCAGYDFIVCNSLRVSFDLCLVLLCVFIEVVVWCVCYFEDAFLYVGV